MKIVCLLVCYIKFKSEYFIGQVYNFWYDKIGNFCFVFLCEFNRQILKKGFFVCNFYKIIISSDEYFSLLFIDLMCF